MENAPSRSLNWPLAGLMLVLTLAVTVHWIKSDVMQIYGDDEQLLRVSLEIREGAWGKIWAPHSAHWFPLLRLARLAFDSDFPARYRAMHVLLMGSHLATAGLLFALARRYLQTPWAALVTTLLFAWSTVGDEALVWKGVAQFALNWPFILLAMWCLAHTGMRWTLGALTALLAAIGFYSATLFVLPGVLAWGVLLERKSWRRTAAVCGIAGLAGLGAWLAFALPQMDLHHYWRFTHPTAGIFTRLAWGVSDLLLAYHYHFFCGVRLIPERHSALLLIPLAGALWRVRRRLNVRWMVVVLAMTALPLFAMLFGRKDPGLDMWKISRYGYHNYIFWAVVFGCLLDGWLLSLRPRWRNAVLAVVPIGALLYLAGHIQVARYERNYLRQEPSQRLEFWLESYQRNSR